MASSGTRDVSTRRAELLGWIAATHRNQRRLAILLVCCAAAAIGLMLWRKPVGVIALAMTGIIGAIGFWITWSHIADWRGRLEQLRRL